MICGRTPRSAPHRESPSRFFHDLWHEPQLHLPAIVGNTARGAKIPTTPVAAAAARALCLKAVQRLVRSNLRFPIEPGNHLLHTSHDALVDLGRSHHHVSKSRHVELVQALDVETHSIQCASLVITMMRHSEHFTSALDLPGNFLLDVGHWHINEELPSTILHALLWCRRHNFHGSPHELRHKGIRNLLRRTILHALSKNRGARAPPRTGAQGIP